MHVSFWKYHLVNIKLEDKKLIFAEILIFTNTVGVGNDLEVMSYAVAVKPHKQLGLAGVKAQNWRYGVFWKYFP